MEGEMMTLNEVIKGLKEGKTFKRYGKEDGFQILTPIGFDYFRHDVAGSGWGGSAELHISVLNSGRWEEDRWMEEG
jgi:hypothetical protein